MLAPKKRKAINDLKKKFGLSSNTVRIAYKLFQDSPSLLRFISAYQVSQRFSIPPQEAFEAMVTLSAPAIGLFKLSFQFTDENGSDIEIPYKYVREYLEFGTLYDHRTGEQFHSPSDVQMAFTATPKLDEILSNE